MAQSYDAIIIGAGVMGASLAFHLSERGLKGVTLERKTVANSTRSLQPNLKVDPIHF